MGWVLYCKHIYIVIGSVCTCHYNKNIQYNTIPPDLFICVSVQLHREHTVLHPFWSFKIIGNIAIFVLVPSTHLHLSQVKHVRVNCLAQRHNIEIMSQC